MVCDGKKALVLENAGDEKFLNLKTRRCSSSPTRRPTSRAPTRRAAPSIRSAAGAARWSRPIGTTQEEQRFLQKLAGHLDAAVNAGKTKSLIIVAPPRALGVLRQAYSHNLREALRAEIDKDFVKLPVHEIEKHLAAG